jgi:hypothetical protein
VSCGGVDAGWPQIAGSFHSRSYLRSQGGSWCVLRGCVAQYALPGSKSVAARFSCVQLHTITTPVLAQILMFG